MQHKPSITFLAVVVMAAIIAIQALVFQDGGILALGALQGQPAGRLAGEGESADAFVFNLFARGEIEQGRLADRQRR